MKNKSVSLIISLMSIALLGVMAMQYYFILQSFDLKSQLFDESVMAALNTAALKAEKNEALHFINEKERQEMLLRKRRIVSLEESKAQSESKKHAEGMRMQSQNLKSQFKELEKEVRRRHPGAVLVDNDFYETYIKDPKYRPYVQYEASVRHEVDGRGQLFRQQDFGIYVTKTAPVIKKSKDDSVRYFVLDPVFGEMIISLPPRVDKKLESEIRQYEQQAKAKLAASYIDSIRTGGQAGASAIEDLANEFERSKRSLGQRIDSRFIVEQLREELQNRNIPLEFNLKISKGQQDSVIYQMAQHLSYKDEGNIYSTVLFPNEVSNKNGATISVYFPNKTSILMGNTKIMLFSSAALLLVLISSFSYIILTILRQKKLTEMKTDFINNMTHEFKTPVATIMIASESLKDSEIMEDKARVKRLAGIIYDENVRLGNHIERVLNIARIDKGDLELERETINVNDLISGVVDSMDLQLSKKNAEIKLNLNAENALIEGDELHLSNVIFNLLDNAIKYCNKNSHIVISTQNKNNSLCLVISDNGIGMTREEMTKAFDQFYRVHTGNVHDVKGFGLGLSYVKDIVKRMSGTVKVKSELNKGTEFEIILPLKK